MRHAHKLGHVAYMGRNRSPEFALASVGRLVLAASGEGEVAGWRPVIVRMRALLRVDWGREMGGGKVSWMIQNPPAATGVGS